MAASPRVEPLLAFGLLSTSFTGVSKDVCVLRLPFEVPGGSIQEVFFPDNGICRAMKKAAKKYPVLVLGCDRDGSFTKTLSDFRFSPTFLRSTEAVLHALRHTQAKAILVDRDQKAADELELVLNVRDMDEEIPIILIGSSTDERTERILMSLPATLLIDKPIRDTSLGRELIRLTANPHP
jgi:CheY-like chemotaxis protein